MTKCSTSDDFEAFVNGDLTSQARDSFLEHIRSCNRCSRELELLQQTDALLKKSHREIIPRAEWIAEMEAMLLADSLVTQSHVMRVSYRIRNFVTLTTAALLLIAATLAVWFISEGKRPAVQPSDKVVTHDSNSTAERQITPDHRASNEDSLVPREPTVLAQGGFLVGKHPADEDGIEVFWVLPIARKP